MVKGGRGGREVGGSLRGTVKGRVVCPYLGWMSGGGSGTSETRVPPACVGRPLFTSVRLSVCP